MYIADSGASHTKNADGEWEDTYTGPKRHVRVFDVVDGKALKGGRIFCEVDPANGVPDGIRTDTKGNLWVSVMSGVDVYSPSGEMIARVLCPETVANAAFGGPDGDDLLLCSSTAAYLLKTKAVGAIYGGAATPLLSCSTTTTTTTTTTNGGTTTTTTTTTTV